jgi:subtilase family serine protease
VTLLFVLVVALNVQATDVAGTHAAIPYPSASTPRAADRGALRDLVKEPISVTVALRLRDVDEAENLLRSLHTPGDPHFHQFLTAEQFVARFAPTEAEVARVIASLAKYRLTAQRTTATTLKVTGMPADMEHAFAVSLRSYEVPARADAPGYTFHAPLGRATIPSEIAGSVTTVVGLDTRPMLRPLSRVSVQVAPQAPAAQPLAGNPPGSLTVTDFVKLYDVQPLYDKGVSGEGRTLAVISFANFTPTDVFAYWSALGLSVNPKRLKIEYIDGGPGATSDASGSLETTLDIEQSGGVAPGAKIIAYLAPNANQPWVDAFAAVVDSNKADTVSVSWGFWEWFQNLENSPVTDPFTGQGVGLDQATHELLLRGAIQGQTFFTASGDGGAYELNHDLGCDGPYSSSDPNSCSLTLSVDYPASDTAMTAGGGTTLPATLEFCLNSACTPPYYTVTIPHERVWGWDYLIGLCKALGYDPVSCGIFPAGSGGGVSVLHYEPWYQSWIPGVQLSQPGQVYEAGTNIAALGLGTYFALPAHFPGRNVPDVSFNADPETGYAVYYTSNVTGFSVQSGWGGTSFVAPQLNGVSALFGQYIHGRFGLLNYPLYDVAQSGEAYEGSQAPLHAIKYGNNWFYEGGNGYNPASGFGTMNVANFAGYLKSLSDGR